MTDPNYPRMMFHPRMDPVTVYSEEQEAALGREWSRTIVASLPREEEPDEEPEEEEPPLLKEPEPEPEPEKIRAHRSAPQAKRTRPAAHKAPAHKRKA